MGETARGRVTFRSHGRGTPVLKMSFRGIGLIERSTGFKDPAMVTRLKEMLKVLREAGRDDVLRDIKDGRIRLRQAWAVYRTGAWQQLPTAGHGLPFVESYKAWIKTKTKPSYRAFATWALNALLKGREPSVAGDLRGTLLEYRQVCETNDSGAMFNRVYATMRAFVRDTMTTDHSLYQDLAGIHKLPEPVKRPKHPQSPAKAATIRDALGAEVGRVWWELCCTGMLPDERFGEKFRCEDGRLHVLGTKREARDRFVPLLVADIRPTRLTKQQFERALRASGLGVRPKDGRDSFAHWCDLAGLPEAWKRALLGHAAANVTQEYGWQESETLLEDATRRLSDLLIATDVRPMPELQLPPQTEPDVVRIAASWREPRLPAHGGLVYLAEAIGTGDVKIGWSRNVPGRLEQLAVANSRGIRVLFVLLGDVSLEQALHLRFAHQCLGGEWFEADGELGEWIAAVQARCSDMDWRWPVESAVGQDSAADLVSADAPRKTRTPSLLIRSQARPSTTPKAKSGQDPKEPAETHENPPNSGGHSGGQS